MISPQAPICSLSHCGLEKLRWTGGKAARLGELIRAGFPVNPGFVLTTPAYSSSLEAGPRREIERLLTLLDPEDWEAVRTTSRHIRRLIEETLIAEEIRHAVAAAYEALGRIAGTGEPAVAVRSSATAECLAENSFAGQQETFLWVRGIENILDSARRCWSSLFTPQAILYRRAIAFPTEAALMAVAFQVMVDARSAGVLFTLNPSNGDCSKIVMEGNWGLGESVVSGEVDPDRIMVDKITLQTLSTSIALKTREDRFDPALNRVIRAEVPVERRSAACLENEEVAALAALAKRVERHFGVPLDIEWAIERHAPFPENIRLLQSRPETAWRKRPRPIRAPAENAVGHVMRELAGGGGRAPAASHD